MKDIESNLLAATMFFAEAVKGVYDREKADYVREKMECALAHFDAARDEAYLLEGP